MRSDDDEPDCMDVRFLAYLNYGRTMNSANFDMLVWELEEAGVIAEPPMIWWVN